jgi:hypothetical protein
MTAVNDDDLATAGGLSLADRIAASERQATETPERAIILPVPGPTSSFLSVRYRALTYRELLKIEERHEKVKDSGDQYLFIATDKLIQACQGILENTGPDEYTDTGHKWTAQTAKVLFRRDLPDNATARQAVLAIFPDEEAVIEHFKEYEQQRLEIRRQIDRETEGNSGARSAAQ